jgi:hypothetical protein
VARARPTVHILSQFLWPDDAPTGLYAENLADGILARGNDVRLVSGTGSYRPSARPAPAAPIERLAHYTGRRGHLRSTFAEYVAVGRAFRRYIERRVEGSDVVIVTSAPPTTVFLHSAIRRRRAVSVYWLQDYYPELVRGVWDPPAFGRRILARLWDRHLGGWDHVVKVAGNLGYSGENGRVIRNWPTLDLGDVGSPRPRTALYSGNLGYGHDLESFVALCASLRDRGFAIMVRGDGPGIGKLPAWIRTSPPLASREELIASYRDAEIHLVAAHPAIQHAVFPSKFWNSLSSGRRIETSGFAGAMLEELREAEKAPYGRHLPQWIEFIASILPTRPERGA